MRIRRSGNVFTKPLPRNGSTRYNILYISSEFCEHKTLACSREALQIYFLM
jgi:hypothetical protein